MGDWFRLATASPQSVVRGFREFLLKIKPDAVYVHHYAHIGLEILREIRHTLPECRLFLTLHEYMAICHHQGQMVKTDSSRRLCNRSSPEECSGCYPQLTPESFWLRRQYIEKHFNAVDHFVSPSHFLRDRYIAWGIAPDRISVIENGQPTPLQQVPNGPSHSDVIKFGYFGQITAYKGVDVLLQAITLLTPEQRRGLQLEMHGANLDQQTESFQARIKELAEPLIREGSVRWIGAYKREDLLRRMSAVDWLIVPSIWWENSPMVIQEAFVCGKPVICSDIGGMAEKVQHGQTGLHFEARNPYALSQAVLTACTDYGMSIRNRGGTFRSVGYEESAAQYISLLDQGVPSGKRFGA